MVEETTIKHEEKHEEREPRKGKRGEVIVVDLGKKASKDVRDLRKGRGRLMDDVEECIEELRSGGALTGSAQPVVVIVERRWSTPGGVVPVLLPPGIPGVLPMNMDRDDDDDDDDDD